MNCFTLTVRKYLDTEKKIKIDVMVMGKYNPAFIYGCVVIHG